MISLLKLLVPALLKTLLLRVYTFAIDIYRAILKSPINTHRSTKKYASYKMDLDEDTFQAIDTEKDEHAMDIDSPIPATDTRPPALETLPNEIYLIITEPFSAQNMIAFSQVHPHTRSHVKEYSKVLTKKIAANETERLQNSMLTSTRADYQGTTLLIALRIWCEHWGRPHSATYFEAGHQFGKDFDEARTVPAGVCVSYPWRRQFWGRLAEFLLRISDLVSDKHAECPIGGCKCGHKLQRHNDWIAERAYTKFPDMANCGAAFLKEIIDSTSHLSIHFCCHNMIDSENWLSMVRDARARPIVREGVSKITAQATRRQELWEAVEKGRGFQPRQMWKSHFSSFLHTTLGLPVPPSGFHYVPMSNDMVVGEGGNDNIQVSEEGIRSTQAARLSRKLCEIEEKERKDPSSFKLLLQAAILEVMDVSDLPFELAVGIPLTPLGGMTWKHCVERYGKVAHEVREKQQEQDIRLVEQLRDHSSF